MGMIRNVAGRADLYLYRGNTRLDLSLSYTSAKQWADVQLHHVGRLGKGKYTFSLRSNKANAFGCGTTWGDLDILVLPETVSASKPPAKGDKNLSGGNSGSAKNLKACTGECDSDAQCAKGLKCFQRSKGEKIPGCKGNGGGKDWDYCYDPKTEVKKPKKVVAYQVPDSRGGCPRAWAANKALVSKKVTVSEASYVV